MSEVWKQSCMDAGYEYQLSTNASSGGWMVLYGTKFAVKRECHLMPLRGDFAPEQQKAKEAEPCA